MKLFDVLVHDPKKLQDVVYRSGLVKSDAKKMVKELKQKGHKAQLATSKNRSEAGISLEEQTDSEE